MKYGFLCAGLITATLTPIAQANTSTQAQQVKANYVSSSYAKTKYPIVFAHGLTGFIRVGTESFGLDYWHQILPDLARHGANTWATRVSPFNSNNVRGEQLLQQVEDILAITGAPKVNLIGHSQGAHSIRYVGGIIPSNVASMTTVAGVNKGSPMADFILKTEDTGLDLALASVVNFVSGAIVWAQGLNPNSFPHDSLASARSLSTPGAIAFNQRFPVGIPSSACGEGAYKQNGMQLYSFTGNTPFNSALDASDYIMKVSSLVVGKEGANDGLVPVCSARFGKTIRDNYRWNHLDEVNQLFGIRGLFSQDPVQVYCEHANRLKQQGL